MSDSQMKKQQQQHIILSLLFTMAEPNLPKKLKSEDIAILYFKDFLFNEKNKELVSMLRAVLAEIEHGLARSSVFFLRVKASNANSYASFRKATVDAEVHRKDNSPLVAPIALFFTRGFAILADFLSRHDPKIPENLAERQALRDLLQFLSNEQSVLIENRGKAKKEFEWTLAVRVAQHLLVPLVPHKTFVIDSYPGIQFERCCQVEHPMHGTKGDTSFGCPKGWHGRADILLLGNEVPFTVVETTGDQEEPDSVSVTSDSSVEVKRGEKFSAETISQVTAQTIVYSFVQHRRNPKAPNSLVPGIGICSEKLILYLYDSVEDILLTTGPIDLYARIGLSGLNTRAVIILWLGLNYGLFANKTPEKYKSYKADFHRVLSPMQLDSYTNESEQPFKARSDENDYFQFLGEETASFQDDVYEHLPERKSVSLK